LHSHGKNPDQVNAAVAEPRPGGDFGQSVLTRRPSNKPFLYLRTDGLTPQNPCDSFDRAAKGKAAERR
ncbi:MAG: hypothetical protein PVG29_08835, partial [Gammaproteobacteria bacterium]